MFSNLKAEMARYNITSKDISECIGKCEKTVSSKMNGKNDFTRREMFLIKDNFFKNANCSIEYLFSA